MQIIPLGVSLDCERTTGFAEFDSGIHSVHHLQGAEKIGIVHCTALRLAFVLAVDDFLSGTDIAFITVDCEFVLVELEDDLLVLVLNHEGDSLEGIAQKRDIDCTEAALMLGNDSLVCREVVLDQR